MVDDKEPKIWITVLKLALGAAMIIGGTGFALWYFSKEQDRASTVEPASAGAVKGWGIANDSPIRNKR